MHTSHYAKIISNKRSPVQISRAHLDALDNCNLREAIQTYCRSGSAVYYCFTDLGKGFERVNHRILLKKSIEKSILHEFVALLKAIFNNTKNKEDFNGRHSDPWWDRSGLRHDRVARFTCFVSILTTF